MEETPAEETWRDNMEIVNALDRLILKAAPELDIVMREIDQNELLPTPSKPGMRR